MGARLPVLSWDGGAVGHDSYDLSSVYLKARGTRFALCALVYRTPSISPPPLFVPRRTKMRSQLGSTACHAARTPTEEA